MDIITLHDAPGYDRDRTVAQPFLDGSQCNMRVIRLSPGQVLRPAPTRTAPSQVSSVPSPSTTKNTRSDERWVCGKDLLARRGRRALTTTFAMPQQTLD
jgi:hypothetical protein